MRNILLSIVVALFLGASPARANDGDAAAAQGLFDEARQLMAQGKLGEACPKLLASMKLDAKPGTALNLADCYEKTGRVASAWARYLETVSLAQRAGQAEREQYARDRAAALLPRISRLTITAATPRGIEVLRDGVAVDAAILGTPVPMDPGEHRIEARTPGKKRWSTVAAIARDGERITVEIPPLDDDAAAASTEQPRAERAGLTPPSVPSPRVAEPPRARARRALTYAAVTVGGAGLAAGAITGALALRKASAVSGACQGTICPLGVDADLSTGRALGTASTVTLVFGGASAAAGIVGLVAGRMRPAPSRVVGVRPWLGPCGGGLEGAF